MAKDENDLVQQPQDRPQEIKQKEQTLPVTSNNTS
jgi:hypothetical protein